MTDKPKDIPTASGWAPDPVGAQERVASSGQTDLPSLPRRPSRPDVVDGSMGGSARFGLLTE